MSAKDDMLDVANSLAETKPWESPLFYTGIERAESRDAYVVHFSLRCHMLIPGPDAREAFEKNKARFFEEWWKTAEGFARPEEKSEDSP